uniref:Uncharacterized protein n=1 Tax=Lygus hesperus TaxID=30085 RepID=A0A0A9WSS0_LYGHE
MLVKVAIERGEFQLQFHGNVILRAELAYPVRPENVPPEEYFEGTKLELEGVVNPKLITCTLDHEWEFVETPKFIRDRCIQVRLCAQSQRFESSAQILKHPHTDTVAQSCSTTHYCMVQTFFQLGIHNGGQT